MELLGILVFVLLVIAIFKVARVVDRGIKRGFDQLVKGHQEHPKQD